MSHIIADNSKFTNDTGEMAAIEAVTAKIWSYKEMKQLQDLQISIFSDNIYALNTPNRSARGSGQFSSEGILPLNHLIHISPQNISLKFQRSPANSKVFGNDCAHCLAQQATKKEQKIKRNLREFPLAKPIVSRRISQLDKKEIFALTLGSNTRVGAFTQSIDKASPRHNTSSLYNGKSKAQASILCQLRTGIARLNGYLSKINAVESGMCSCNMRAETIHQFLFYCPLLV